MLFLFQRPCGEVLAYLIEVESWVEGTQPSLLANPIKKFTYVCLEYFIILKVNKNKYKIDIWDSNTS